MDDIRDPARRRFDRSHRLDRAARDIAAAPRRIQRGFGRFGRHVREGGGLADVRGHLLASRGGPLQRVRLFFRPLRQEPAPALISCAAVVTLRAVAWMVDTIAPSCSNALLKSVIRPWYRAGTAASIRKARLPAESSASPSSRHRAPSPVHPTATGALRQPAAGPVRASCAPPRPRDSLRRASCSSAIFCRPSRAAG